MIVFDAVYNPERTTLISCQQSEWRLVKGVEHVRTSSLPTVQVTGRDPPV